MVAKFRPRTVFGLTEPVPHISRGAYMHESSALLGSVQVGSVCVVATGLKGHGEYAIQTGARSTRQQSRRAAAALVCPLTPASTTSYTEPRKPS